MTDEEHGQAIHQALSTLNDAIGRANEDGIEVEVASLSFGHLSTRVERICVMANAYRRIDII